MESNEILREMRRDRERQYASQLRRNQIQFPLTVPSVLPLPSVPLYEKKRLWDCANKTTAVYCANTLGPARAIPTVLGVSYYTWKGSERPCIEFGRFLSKTILYGQEYNCGTIGRSALDSEFANINGIVRTHLELCEQFDALHHEICEQKAKNLFKEWEHPGISGSCPSAFNLTSLFRALLVIVLDPLQSDDNWAHERGERISVKLVLTGSNEGLEIPIDLSDVSPKLENDGGQFQAVTTTLNEALRYISALQDRQSKLEGRQNLELQQQNGSSSPEFYPSWNWKELLARKGYEYTGPPIITPQLLIDHQDRSYFPDTLYTPRPPFK